MSLSDVSSGVSAARFAMNPTPLGAASLVGGAVLGGKGGGKKNPLIPGYENGKYTVNGNPNNNFNKYQVSTDKGTYNFLPSAMSLYRPNGLSKQESSDINNKIISGFNGDQQAIDYYKNNFYDPYTPLKQDAREEAARLAKLTPAQRTNERIQSQIINSPRPMASIAQQEAEAARLAKLTPTQRANERIQAHLTNNSPLGQTARMDGINPYHTTALAQNAITKKFADYATKQGLLAFTPSQIQQPQSAFTPSAQLDAQIAAARSQQ